MKLSDIPPHVTQINPPWFPQRFHAVYGTPCDYDDAVPLYPIDYWDGPLSCIFTFHGHTFYGKAIYPMDRRYWAAWELTPEEIRIEKARHEEFRKYVGTHTDYFQNDEGEWKSTSAGTLKPEGEWRKYYDNKDLEKVDWKEVEKRDIFGVTYNPVWGF